MLAPSLFVTLLLTASPGAASTQTGRAEATLRGAYWKAVELSGMHVPSMPVKHEPHLVFQPDGRVSGADGCNRIMGTYTVKGDAIAFGQVAGTQMACTDTAEVERRFRSALARSGHWRIQNNRLELIDATGKPLAVFERQEQPAPPTATSPLQGTRWQLVRFQGGDGATLTPDDRSKYTIAFETGGRLTARVDCNRGRGTWKSDGPSQLQFGPMALTRAKCPPGSLHDQIVKQWPNIRSFVIKDGRLFLSLMADGGIYEFEPVTK
jgi:heat shock protein HslJ